MKHYPKGIDTAVYRVGPKARYRPRGFKLDAEIDPGPAPPVLSYRCVTKTTIRFSAKGENFGKVDVTNVAHTRIKSTVEKTCLAFQ